MNRIDRRTASLRSATPRIAIRRLAPQLTQETGRALAIGFAVAVGFDTGVATTLAIIGGL